MRIFSPALHGILDYIFIAALVLVTFLAGLSGLAAAILYLLAAVFLVMTLTTAFPLGSIKVLSFAAHQSIELVIGMVLLVCPWIFGFASDPYVLFVYIVGGFTLLLIHLLTSEQMKRS